LSQQTQGRSEQGYSWSTSFLWGAPDRPPQQARHYADPAALSTRPESATTVLAHSGRRSAQPPTGATARRPHRRARQTCPMCRSIGGYTIRCRNGLIAAMYPQVVGEALVAEVEEPGPTAAAVTSDRLGAPQWIGAWVPATPPTTLPPAPASSCTAAPRSCCRCTTTSSTTAPRSLPRRPPPRPSQRTTPGSTSSGSTFRQPHNFHALARRVLPEQACPASGWGSFGDGARPARRGTALHASGAGRR
jgi:hypothetical protein